MECPCKAFSMHVTERAGAFWRFPLNVAQAAGSSRKVVHADHQMRLDDLQYLQG